MKAFQADTCIQLLFVTEIIPSECATRTHSATST